jgi:hypothetical protein
MDTHDQIHRRLTPYTHHVKDHVPIILFAPHVQKFMRYVYVAIIDAAWDQGQIVHIAAAWIQVYVQYRWHVSSTSTLIDEAWQYDGCATEAFEYEITRNFKHVVGCLSIVHKILTVSTNRYSTFNAFLKQFVRALERKCKVDLSHNTKRKRDGWRVGSYELEILNVLHFDIPFVGHTVFAAYEEFVHVGCAENHPHRFTIESIIHDTYALDPTLHLEMGKDVVAAAVYLFAKHHLCLENLEPWQPPEWLRSDSWDATVHTVVGRMYRLARPNSYALFRTYNYFRDLDLDTSDGELVTVDFFV